MTSSRPEPQTPHRHAAGGCAQEELPLVDIVHQRQYGPGRHQPEQHVHAGALVFDCDVGADSDGPQGDGADQGPAELPALFQLQYRPHQGQRRPNQGNIAQDGQGFAQGQVGVDSGIIKGKVNIKAIDKHQQSL